MLRTVIKAKNEGAKQAGAVDGGRRGRRSRSVYFYVTVREKETKETDVEEM
jgi:hypothetical protein